MDLSDGSDLTVRSTIRRSRHQPYAAGAIQRRCHTPQAPYGEAAINHRFSNHALPTRSPHLDQFNLEYQGGVGWDHAASASRTVSQIGRNGELALSALLHPCYAQVPTLNDLPGAKLEGKRSASVIGCVKLPAIYQCAAVVN